MNGKTQNELEIDLYARQIHSLLRRLEDKRPDYS